MARWPVRHRVATDTQEMIMNKAGRPAKLTGDQIQEIITWAKNRRSVKEFAKQYGVSISLIYKIANKNNCCQKSDLDVPTPTNSAHSMA